MPDQATLAIVAAVVVSMEKEHRLGPGGKYKPVKKGGKKK